MISVTEEGKEGYTDIAIPPESFNVVGIQKLISKEFEKQPDDVQNLLIEGSKTKVNITLPFLILYL